jgi:hypothetical protein
VVQHAAVVARDEPEDDRAVRRLTDPHSAGPADRSAGGPGPGREVAGAAINRWTSLGGRSMGTLSVVDLTTGSIRPAPAARMRPGVRVRFSSVRTPVRHLAAHFQSGSGESPVPAGRIRRDHILLTRVSLISCCSRRRRPRRHPPGAPTGLVTGRHVVVPRRRVGPYRLAAVVRGLPGSCARPMLLANLAWKAPFHRTVIPGQATGPTDRRTTGRRAAHRRRARVRPRHPPRTTTRGLAPVGGEFDGAH